ncbi:hypothetical protein EPN28_02150 [Patescibacteria group bacterium]|nr:MAG: hypothetical protein EPN28_02150 [Patescibacteria group bacterium]
MPQQNYAQPLVQEQPDPMAPDVYGEGPARATESEESDEQKAAREAEEEERENDLAQKRQKDRVGTGVRGAVNQSKFAQKAMEIKNFRKIKNIKKEIQENEKEKTKKEKEIKKIRRKIFWGWVRTIGLVIITGGVGTFMLLKKMWDSKSEQDKIKKLKKEIKDLEKKMKEKEEQVQDLMIIWKKKQREQPQEFDNAPAY